MTSKKDPPKNRGPSKPGKTVPKKKETHEFTFTLILHTEEKETEILYKNDVKKTAKSIKGRWGNQFYPVMIVHESGKIWNQFVCGKYPK